VHHVNQGQMDLVWAELKGTAFMQGQHQRLITGWPMTHRSWHRWTLAPHDVPKELNIESALSFTVQASPHAVMLFSTPSLRYPFVNSTVCVVDSTVEISSLRRTLAGVQQIPTLQPRGKGMKPFGHVRPATSAPSLFSGLARTI